MYIGSRLTHTRYRIGETYIMYKYTTLKLYINTHAPFIKSKIIMQPPTVQQFSIQLPPISYNLIFMNKRISGANKRRLT